MLKQILDAHGGTLPDDVHVCFANTGKEREETLRFVHECETRWSVRVHWLEWRPAGRGSKAEDRFEEVGYNSADRSGKWFAELIRRKQFLPNSQMRYCTTKLKVETMKWFMVARGYEKWLNPVGLRADEMGRVFKQYARNESGKERFTAVMPLAKAGARLGDVTAFWDAQPFDLQLKPYEGNCDLCFLKGRGKRAEIIREFPEIADWWIAVEKSAKTKMPGSARFIATESVEQLRASVLAQDMFNFNEGSDPDDEHDAECGLWCAGEAA